MGKNILVLVPANEEHKKLLKDKAPNSKFIFSDYQSINDIQVHEANIIIGNPPVSIIKDFKKLEWIQLESAGADKYVEPDVLPPGVILTNASGAYGLAVSEYMLSVLLELYKKLHLYRDNQSVANWSNQGQVKSIYNSTVLIIGFGDIGSEFAKRIKALGAYTIGIRRNNVDKPEYLDEIHFMDNLEELLPNADIVTLSLPNTQFTNKIINQHTLELFKKDAVLINVGRGESIDTMALCDALENGHLFGAALDVTDPEPLPKEHRLWGINNVVITPHAAGGLNLQETHDRIIRLCADNLDAFLNKKDLKNVVDIYEGY